MACFSIANTRLLGLSASVPRTVAANADLEILPEKDRERLIKTTGIARRRIAPPDMCASDLCAAAAQQLLDGLGWSPESVDALVLVTQTPDYTVPGTATQLQQRLGLGKNTLSLDINQGCAGYVYGLSTAAALVATGGIRRALLLVGDTITHTLSPRDQSTVPIFSDAGSATALAFDPDAPPMHFHLQSDGSGHRAICIPDGGARHPLSPTSLEWQSFGTGLARMGVHLGMDGLDIFNFALAEVPPNVRALLAYAGCDAGQIDHFVFHQANLLLNEMIRKKLGLPTEKVPYSLADYGNTSCATIPVTLVSQLRDTLKQTPQRLLLSGFGVGLSWGSALVETPALSCPPIMEL
jgi:3-oxoacyl-[acyl-carrier-protein] synthase III